MGPDGIRLESNEGSREEAIKGIGLDSWAVRGRENFGWMDE